MSVVNVGRTFLDSCITQLKAQGPSRTCNESKEEEEVLFVARVGHVATRKANSESFHPTISMKVTTHCPTLSKFELFKRVLDQPLFIGAGRWNRPMLPK